MEVTAQLNVCHVQHDKDATAEDQWFTTGDVATIDRFGHFQITDRSKDLIKTGGEWVSSIELDGIIMSHPAVRRNPVLFSSCCCCWLPIPVE